MPPRLARARALLLPTACLLLATAPPAGADTMSRTFAPIKAPQTFDVPPGVTEIQVEAVGARGGSAGEARGGFGARVTGTIAVTPGQRLWVLVGGNGVDGRVSPGDGFNGGNHGGSAYFLHRAGQGGGASDVRVCAPGAPGSECGDGDPLGRLIVAGGGGGAGGNNMEPHDLSGDGGDAGQPGETAPDSGHGPAAGGGAGTATAGGAAGAHVPGQSHPAEAGSLGVGGIGATALLHPQHSGGGGGGGRYGGGGGGTAVHYGGGGGGGSNLVPAGGTAAIDTTGSPEITLTWETGDPATIDAPTLDRPAIYADDLSSATVTTVVRDADGAPVAGADLSFHATAPAPDFGPVVDHGDGRYTATVTGTARGTSSVTARVASPELTSPAMTLEQVRRPTVTAPARGIPAIGDLLGSAGTVSLEGTADPGTASVDLYCVEQWFAMRFDGAAATVPVVDGAWSVADAAVPASWARSPGCRAVAVPSSMPADDAETMPGARIRTLKTWVQGAPDAIVGFEGELVGLSGMAGVTGFGESSWMCDFNLGAVDASLAPSPTWLDCGGDLSRVDPLDGRPGLTVDGHFAMSAGMLGGLASLAGAPRLSLERAVTRDGSLALTERSPLARCTGSDDPATDAAGCGELVDTGVRLVARTVVSPSGRHATRTLVFESSDGRPHDVEAALTTSTRYTRPQLRFGDEATWTARTAAETVDVSADRWSVLLRDGADLARPAIAFTTVPAPAAQRVENGRLAQRQVVAVPAAGVAGVALTFDLVDVAEVDAAAAAARDAFDVAVAIDAPATGTTTSEATATVTGTASDEAGPAALRVGGEPVAVADDGTWSATVPLALGENAIEAVVTSPFGPREAAAVTITRVEQPSPGRPVTGGTPPAPDPSPKPSSPPDETTPSPGAPPPAPAAPRPPAAQAPVARDVSVRKRARLGPVLKRGIPLRFTLPTGDARVVAELRAPWGTFARTVERGAGPGRVALRLRPSAKATARARRALASRRAVRLRLVLKVRSGSATTRTTTKVRLVR